MVVMKVALKICFVRGTDRVSVLVLSREIITKYYNALCCSTENLFVVSEVPIHVISTTCSKLLSHGSQLEQLVNVLIVHYRFSTVFRPTASLGCETVNITY
jgi:hypothetical protein